MQDALESVKAELGPALQSLVELAEQEGERGQRDFFDRILQLVHASRDLEDMAAPLMELSTSAFLGFRYSLAAQLLLDRALAVAQNLAMTLSAEADTPH